MGLFNRLSKLLAKVKTPPVTSSTSEYPAPKDVFVYLIAELEHAGEGFVTFVDQDDEEKWVQVMIEPEGRRLNFSYPSDDEPKQLLTRLHVGFPATFELSSWEGQLYATFDIPRLTSMELAGIIDELFVKLLKVRLHYVVKGEIDR